MKATPLPHTTIYNPEVLELAYNASVIDGCVLSLLEYVQKKKNPALYTSFFLKEFYRLLQISVQTKTEAEFHKHLDDICNIIEN